MDPSLPTSFPRNGQDFGPGTTSTQDQPSHNDQAHNQELRDLAAFDSLAAVDGFNTVLNPDLMTPEYTEPFQSEHTTPQERIWEEQFVSPRLDTIDRPSNSVSSVAAPICPPPSAYHNSSSLVDENLPQYVSGAQLLSPQPTTPSPQAPASRSLPLQGAMMIPPLPQSSEDQQPSIQHQHALTAEALNLSQTSGYHASTSPIVIVSSHTHGEDSTVQSTAPRARSSGKRSREGSLHETYSRADEDDARSDYSSSRLMPPQHFEPYSYADESKEDRTGLSPSERGGEQVASINELAERRALDERNAGVQDWLSKSIMEGVPGEDPNGIIIQGRPHRPRAHTTGARLDPRSIPLYPGYYLPGPGVLLDEPSDDGLSIDDSASILSSAPSSPVPESPPVSQARLLQQEDSPTAQSFFPAFSDLQLSPESEEPLPSQFIRQSPWQDPVRGPITDRQSQPKSSNEAARMFDAAATHWESASRAATWGTGRRLTEHEITAIVNGSGVRHLSLAERGSNMISKARGIIARRSNSNTRKATPSPTPDPEPIQQRPEAPMRRESTSPIKALQRIPSFSKPKSPSLTTGSAIMAMTGNLAVVGSGQTGPFTTEPENLDRPEKADGLRSPLKVLRKRRSKSEAYKSNTKASPGLADLMRSHGGPPMPKLASPMQERSQLLGEELRLDDDDDDDNNNNNNNNEMADEVDEVGVKMDLSVRADNIIPSVEGFKAEAQRLNPRLEPFLIERLGQEQRKRYKKLLENKIKHTQAVKVLKECSSGSQCTSLGGKATLLPPRVSVRDTTESVGAQFQISSPADGEGDDLTFDEGVVTPAQFPDGIPLPPVNRLPAEFECFLCFKVKKILKPSDWTKHVHEDTQPFTCTFPNCNEVKSFKRKADWVRHENERHRRLEYWKCSVQGCIHVCYRKDNFVQHLVREHKMAEPKTKSRGSGSSKAPPLNSAAAAAAAAAAASQAQLDDECSRLVDSCRHENTSRSRDEPCRFCGNVCNSWKKLSVHLGKHLEQIAMPVIQLVNTKEIGPDTSISPIEQKNVHSIAAATTPATPSATITTAGAGAGAGAASATTTATTSTIAAPRAQIMDGANTPYAMNARSAYQGSSAGHSPADMIPSLMPNYSFDQPYHPHHMSPAIPPDFVLSSDFSNTGQGQSTATNVRYAPRNSRDFSNTNFFVSVNPQQFDGSFPTTPTPNTMTMAMAMATLTPTPTLVPNSVSSSQQQQIPSSYTTHMPTAYSLPSLSMYGGGGGGHYASTPSRPFQSQLELGPTTTPINSNFVSQYSGVGMGVKGDNYADTTEQMYDDEKQQYHQPYT